MFLPGKRLAGFVASLRTPMHAKSVKNISGVTAITRAKSTTTKSPGRQGQSRDIAANVEGNFRDEAGLPSRLFNPA
jgi:hypothetical protein